MLISLVMVGASLTHAQAFVTTTTVSFVAHQDDDLLFMNPDIASDVQAGYNVWVVYLTAGEVHDLPAMPYANQRIEGERAAYAKTANVPNAWTYEEMWFNGHPVATNRLNGTNVRLVFTFVHAASGGCDGGDPQGDLYKMLADGQHLARPIDGRPAYTRASFVGMLRSVLEHAKPDYIRSGSSIGHRDSPRRDHVDHVAGAILTAEADLVNGTRDTWIRRDEYTAYNSENQPENVFGYWSDRKVEIWDQYWPHDPKVGRNDHAYMFIRQIRPEGRIFHPGTAWVPPGDFAVAGC
ncbi:PIG-L family deacetylase [Lentzea sp. NPDC059081]|uniref:PIG-L family deacetylase n=1 Tax=Lentzea sp. NPDC059081 TaxID=3346719 RepID=UPI0036A354BA